MLKKVFKCFVALVAIAAAATGPARAQQTYTVTFTGFSYDHMNTTVSDATMPYSINEIDDSYIALFNVTSNMEGDNITSLSVTGGDGKVSVSQDGGPFMILTITGAFEGTAQVHCEGTYNDPNFFDPQPVSGDFYVTCVANVAPSLYTVKMAPGTEDSVKWVFDPMTAATDGVVEGTVVNISYTGSRKVKDVVATVTYPEGAVSLATPLTIEAITAGTITVQDPQSGMQYSLNGGEKTAVSGDITVAVGDKVAFYGNGTNITVYDGTKILGSGDGFTCKVYGNIMSLVDENNYETATTLPNVEYVFYELFNGNTALTDASGLLLPATTLVSGCYTGMFQGCVNLTAAPELPATTLAISCYYNMFRGCTGLTAAPELPATALATYCYSGMFQNCTTLVAAPALPATTLAQSCYYGMFNGCAALTTAPDMLPATTLATGCYRGMFQNCTTLVAAPVLPAPTLVSNCYNQMFLNCSNLSSVTCLATSGINENNSTNNWLQDAGSNVNGTKTFRAAANAEWPTNSNNGIPTGWTRQNPDGSAYVPPTITVTINLSDWGNATNSFTKDGVTVSASDIDPDHGNLTSDGSFSTTLGNFTSIVVTTKECDASGTGWSGCSWSGTPASSVSFNGDFYGDGLVQTTIVCTIVPNN